MWCSWEDLDGTAFWRKYITGDGHGIKSPVIFPICSLFHTCGWRCGHSSSCSNPYVCLFLCLPTIVLDSYLSRTITPKNFFLILVFLVMLFYKSYRKVTNSMSLHFCSSVMSPRGLYSPLYHLLWFFQTTPMIFYSWKRSLVGSWPSGWLRPKIITQKLYQLNHCLVH